MSWLRKWRERRRWRKELRAVPLHQLRGMVQGSHFYQNPDKQRWAERWLWRRENLPDLALKLGSGLIVALGSAIAIYYLGLK
jgi:hypothetical protein